MIENSIEGLKERLCSCDNNDLKDFESSESWGYSGFLETLLEFYSLDAHRIHF
jgi:hypothetical protein